MNKAKPEVKIKLDRERTLLFNLNSMVAFQEETGKNLFQRNVAESLQKNMSPKDLRALLWAGLLHEDKTLKIEQVGGWITPGNLEDIAASINSAWELATPDSEEVKEEDPLSESPPAG